MSLLTKLEVSLGDMSDLTNVDIKSSFVTVSVDSNRINATFDVVLEALRNVRIVVANVCSSLETTKVDVQGLQKDLTSLTHRWETDPRFAEITDVQAKQGRRISTVEEQLAALQLRLDKFETRLAAQETKRVDFSPLENAIKQIRAEAEDLRGRLSEVGSLSADNSRRLQSVSAEVEKLRLNGESSAGRLKALYAVLEMNEDLVLRLTGDPSQMKRREGSIACGLTDYVVSLPAFQVVHGKMQTAVSQLETATAEQLTQQKKKLAEEAASIRARLAEKLDEKLFFPVRNELDNLVRRQNALEPRMDRLAEAVEGKADLATTEKQYHHLNTVKADKADLVGLLKRDDLLPIEKDLQALAQAIDSSGAKLKLEMRELKQTHGVVTPEPPARRGSDEGVILARIAVTEKDIKILKDEKLGKDVLADLYVYLDNALAKLQGSVARMPTAEPTSTTPGITPAVDTPTNTNESRPLSGKRRLAPLLRPPSAGGGRREDTPPSPSIPEAVRTPSPPLQYTSSPAKYVPNGAKYRATASIYDSDGNRTLATVTAAHVPMVEHWHNVARAAAGEEIIPEGMRRHSMD